MWGFIYFVVVVVSVQAVLALPVPRKRATDFAADSSINATGILAKGETGTKVLKSFSSGDASHNSMVKIYGDWLVDSDQVFYFTADMDVDCDGVAVSEVPIFEPQQYD
jgi:hypothetical protein